MMLGKKGTPTMGGILIIFAIALTTLLLANLDNFYVGMGLICLIWLGAVGAVDDWLKLTTQRRAKLLPPGVQVSRQGLTSLEKLIFQLGWVFCFHISHFITVWIRTATRCIFRFSKIWRDRSRRRCLSFLGRWC